MEFNTKDYKDNISYCEYVFNNIEGLELELKTPAEVQYVANKYADKVNEVRGYESDELYEDDAMLLGIAQKAIRKFQSLKKGFKTIEEEELQSSKKTDAELQEAMESFFEKQQDLIDEKIDLKFAYEKNAGRKGGHNFTELYDDYGLDEIYDENEVKLR